MAGGDRLDRAGLPLVMNFLCVVSPVHCWEMDNVTRPHLVEVLSEQQQAFLVMALQVQEKMQDRRIYVWADH